MKKDKMQDFRPIDMPTWSTPLDPKNLIQTDPFGMYTGVPADKVEKPQQDADDL